MMNMSQQKFPKVLNSDTFYIIANFSRKFSHQNFPEFVLLSIRYTLLAIF